MQEQARAAIRQRIASNIRRLRKLHNLTQAALAERSGRESRHVGLIELSKTNVGIDIITDLAWGLGVDAHELLVPTANEQPRKSKPFARVPSKDLETLRNALGVVLRAEYEARR